MSADNVTEAQVIEKYKGELGADVYAPPSGVRRTAVVFFHGGGWSGGAPSQFVPQCERLAELGHVAMTVQYRLLGRDAKTPADAVADAKSAIRWVRSNAGRFGVDPDRVVAGGGSAGAHLAACTAFVDGFDDPADDLGMSCVPDGLALFNPPLDLLSLPATEPVKQMLELFGPDTEALSPLLHVRAGGPPAVLFHGTKDALVGIEQARRFRDAMLACGNHVELHEYEAGHGFFNFGQGANPWFGDTLAHLARFVASLGVPTPSRDG